MWMREKSPLDKLIEKRDLIAKHKVTKFQQDLLRYMHVFDCRLTEGKWESYWEFCPVCGGEINKEGYVEHRNRKFEEL